MDLISAVKLSLPIKRASWHDWLTVQECDCYNRRKHSECPEPALMFPEYVDPKLTPADILADDWICDEKSQNKG